MHRCIQALSWIILCIISKVKISSVCSEYWLSPPFYRLIVLSWVQFWTSEKKCQTLKLRWGMKWLFWRWRLEESLVRCVVLIFMSFLCMRISVGSETGMMVDIALRTWLTHSRLNWYMELLKVDIQICIFDAGCWWGIHRRYIFFHIFFHTSSRYMRQSQRWSHYHHHLQKRKEVC